MKNNAFDQPATRIGLRVQRLVRRVFPSRFRYLAATTLMGRDWHALSHNEREMVRDLERCGYLEPAKDGFVGWPPA